MVKRGRRDLDLTARRELPVHRNHLAADLSLLAAQQRLILDGLIALLSHKFRDLCIFLLELLVHPS